ncbi:hypothetical protein [Oceanobacter mangrovi]|uniref:hypothetical protein n=1 Tax=Oceanobacter mangrovi TaxID=2862510 RepID=UPI001C8EE345|nr:hypothetical protein [Oceanobacter mangrovi]
MSKEVTRQAVEQHTFRFDQFSIRGAIHHHTDLTIKRGGQWSIESRVSTVVSSFKPRISLYVEFFLRDTELVVPVGNVPDEWKPKCLWQQTFGMAQEKIVKASGSSDYIRERFEELSQHAEGKLKMRIQKKPGLLARFF